MAIPSQSANSHQFISTLGPSLSHLYTCWTIPYSSITHPLHDAHIFSHLQQFKFTVIKHSTSHTKSIQSIFCLRMDSNLLNFIRFLLMLHPTCQSLGLIEFVNCRNFFRVLLLPIFSCIVLLPLHTQYI